MDPLSVTASIIALFQAGGKVSTGLKKIANLRNAPDILLALNNEVADLHCLVENVDDVLHQHREIIGLEPIACLCRALDRVKRTLWKLENVLAYQLTSIKCKDGESHLVLDRSSWLRLESSVQQLKDEIREDKISLSSALSVLTSFTAFRTYVLLGTMRLESRTSGPSRIEAAPQPATEDEDPAEQALNGLPQPVQVGQGTKSDPDTATGTETHGSLQDVVWADSSPAELEQQPYSTTFEIARNACGPRCDCTCHRRLRFRSPGFMDAVFGSLFLGYQASPWFSQGCRNGRCRRSSTRIQYMFPRWFVKRSVALTIARSQPKGPELVLRVLRLRPNNAFIFVCAQKGYYNELKRLLENGEASVVDIDEYNRTALSVAINYRRLNMVKLLLQAGSDVFHEDAYGIRPSMPTLAEFLARKVRGGRNEFADPMFDLINSHSHIDMSDFPELTEAYLRLCPQSFDEVLRSTLRVSIDLADRLGRTTLHWASTVGDNEAVEQLLRCGADPNKTDTWGRTSLHLSSYGNSRCQELLLRAKADVDLKDVNGQTALHYLSAYGWNTMSPDLLLRYGANIEATNHFGQTPLHCAVMKDHLMVSGLLEGGANINARATNGWTCLHQALFDNCYNSLGILLDNTALRYNVKTNAGRTLLHLAALYADIESLYILMSKPLYELDTAEEDEDGWTALEFAQYRRLNNEGLSIYACRPRDDDPAEWYCVFEKLMDSIIEAQASMAGSIDDEASEEEMAGSEGPSSPADENCEDDENEESWKDAQEDLDGQSQGE